MRRLLVALAVVVALLAFTTPRADAQVVANATSDCIRWTGTATWSPCTFYTPWGTATVVTPRFDLGYKLYVDFRWAYGVTCITGLRWAGNVVGVYGLGACSTWAPYGIARLVTVQSSPGQTVPAWSSAWITYGGAHFGGQSAFAGPG